MKSPASKPKPNTADPELYAKLHCVRALFAAMTRGDAELEGHIRSAIDYSLTGELDTPAPLVKFCEAAFHLQAENPGLPASYGLALVDLRDRRYEPLWLREEVVSAIRKLAGHQTALLVIYGLRQALYPGARAWTQKRLEHHAAVVESLDTLAAREITANTRFSLLYV